jgi:predicted NAD/FAD-binding protein
MSIKGQKIAIIGSGISGLGAAYLLNPHHDITIYEKNDYIGGHSRTLTISMDEETHAVDTGFIVFNHQCYPHLTALFSLLGVETQKTSMSFGVISQDPDLEWGAEGLNALFGQRRNIIRPHFWRFLWDVLAFNRRAKSAIQKFPGLTLGALLDKLELGEWFRQFYIVPMGGAIWSCSLEAMLNFPANFFVDFFDKHGLLTVTQQPQWYSVVGGSSHYINKLCASFRDRIRLSQAVSQIRREEHDVYVISNDGQSERYDQVIFACHGPEVLGLLADPSEQEYSILSEFKRQKNKAYLHRSSQIMPRNKACWSSWTYHAPQNLQDETIAVTYWMNHLQGIKSKEPIFVTLNPLDPLPEDSIFDCHEFYHPIYTPQSVKAQKDLISLQGKRQTWFCGAYTANGFHEDGLKSAVMIAGQMGVMPPW